jgi:hypothetical protein
LPDPPEGWSAGACSPEPIVSLETVALSVERDCTSGAMLFAFGPEEAAEFVTAWHTPPVTPVHEPSPRDPRGFGDTDGSVAVAALVTLPVHAVSPVQASVAPDADAADGPAGSRAGFTGWPPDSASAAPGPVDACDTDCTWQPPVPPVQLAVPSDVRGFPPATAPSQAAVLVRTEPEQAVPVVQLMAAVDDDVDEGPLSARPAIGSPVAGSIVT